jgi:hypothetical protein
MDFTIEALPFSWLCMAKERKPFFPIVASARRAVVIAGFLPEAFVLFFAAEAIDFAAFFAGENFLLFFVELDVEDFAAI